MKIKFHAIAIALTAMLVATSCATKNNSDKDDDSTDEKEAVEQNNDADAEDEIAEDAVIEVTDADELISYIDGQEYSKPIVLEFNATWCGPCQAFKPVYHQVANKYNGRIEFYSIDIDNCPAIAQKYGIQGIPAMIVITPDGILDQPGIDGATTADELETILQEYI